MTKLSDVCLSSCGATVVLATSCDERYPPENILDGKSETFWTTTGIFPQEFIIGFSGPAKINKLTVQSYLVRNLKIEKSISKDPVNFEKCAEKELENSEGQLQTEEFMLPGCQATYLRFIIESSFDQFVSIHRVMADGNMDNISSTA
ncbi:intraflagellar transport protein 25 homolog [Microcaecilia unicolor]|uniref:Intraflagellar transport protein 25 homolog n=1 Tax=Microcaecilia unicolor TaxID=1415580 RepID=A0A6P7YG14_9AMPH|nr:intraflagellar transport protein 25 homolog [Microcaecilia unicolor]